MIVSRPVHKSKQIRLLTSLKTLHPVTTGNDEALYDLDLPLQLKKRGGGINDIYNINRASLPKVTIEIEWIIFCSLS